MTFQNQKILIIADFNPQRICGLTTHLNYLKDHFARQNQVRLQTRASLKELRWADVIWFRSEKKFLSLFLVGKIFRKKLVYDLASFPWLELVTTRRSWWRIQFSWWVFKLATAVAQIRVLSQAMKDYLVQKHHLRPTRIDVLHIPVQLQAVAAPASRDGKIHFIYTGSNRSWQGLSALFQAFQQLEAEPEFQLHCYGITGENTPNITFHAAIPHADLIQVMINQMDVVVVPRERNIITETVMPIKYAEAVHLDKYVLATDLKVLHEIATPKVVFTRDNSAAELCAAIRSFKPRMHIKIA